MGLTYTFVSICGDRFSNWILRNGSIPLHSVSIVNFYGGMCFVKHVQEVRCCFYVGHDDERILNISSIERREFTLSLKVFFDVGHEHISYNHGQKCWEGNFILQIPPSPFSMLDFTGKKMVTFLT